MSANLTDQDPADLARILRDVIEADRFPLPPKVNRWKELLSKLDPAREQVTTPFPPPKLSEQPSHLLARKRRP